MNHLFIKPYIEITKVINREGERCSYRQMRIPAVVKKVTFPVRGRRPSEWRLIEIYVNHPEQGIILQNAKLSESYYISSPDSFVSGSDIEVVVPIEGENKGMGTVRLIGDDCGIIYDWVFLSQKESDEAEYIQKYKPRCLFKLIQAFLENYLLKLEQNEYSIEQSELLRIYKETVSSEYEEADGLNVSNWFTDSEAEEDSWQYARFLNSTASKWNFKQFRKNVRSLMEYEKFNVPKEVALNVQDNLIFYDAYELPEKEPFSQDTVFKDFNFYEVDDYYNDQLDLDQQDPQFYDNL